ncbi:hypothetical protein EVAR_66488_1, partial [Eumeta japonica]
MYFTAVGFKMAEDGACARFCEESKRARMRNNNRKNTELT